MKFLDLAKKVLEESQRPMTASEIWKDAVRRGYDQQLETKGKTPKETLGARLYTSANDPDNNAFGTIGERPKRFYLPQITPAGTLKYDQEEAPVREEKEKYRERDLHQVLV